jgi:hypothetical protein
MFHAAIPCNSDRNTGAGVAGGSLVRITHPFHPLSGRSFACVGERFNRYGKRLLLQIDESTICTVPPDWTDLAVKDTESIIGEGRALFRVVDLIDLERLVTRLLSRQSTIEAQ